MASRIRTGDIQVEGLRELHRALKALDVEGGSELSKELRGAHKEAADGVRSKAYGRAMSIGGVAAKAAPSLKARAGAQSAGVAVGGAAYPFGLGAEFGAYRYKQFSPWRGNGSDAGYFLYPTIRDEADSIIEPYLEALDAVTRKAFPR